MTATWTFITFLILSSQVKLVTPYYLKHVSFLSALNHSEFCVCSSGAAKIAPDSSHGELAVSKVFGFSICFRKAWACVPIFNTMKNSLSNRSMSPSHILLLLRNTFGRDTQVTLTEFPFFLTPQKLGLPVQSILKMGWIVSGNGGSWLLVIYTVTWAISEEWLDGREECCWWALAAMF